jgi:chemotaxis protein CheX
MDVNVMNALISATNSVMEMTTGIVLKTGKPSLCSAPVYEEPICIIVGITGEQRGQVTISMTRESGIYIAGVMMQGMGSGLLDELTKSALQELSNMTMGTFATLLANKLEMIIDITPPTLIEGENISLSGGPTIRIPMLFDGGEIILNLALKAK